LIEQLIIYTGTSKNNATNLTAREIEVLKFIAGKNKYDTEGKLITENSVTKQDIMKKFNISSGRAHQILHGKDGKGGMLAKVAQLHKVDKSITTGGPDEDKEKIRKNEYVFTGKKIGLEIYDTVASIDENIVPEVKENFMKTLSEETVTHCYPTITIDKITVKPKTEDRIKRNVTLKNENKSDTKITHASKQSKEKTCVKNKSLSKGEKEDNSVTVEAKTSQPNTVKDDFKEVNRGVTEGNSSNSTSTDTENKGNSSLDNDNIYEIVSLLKRALPNYAKNKYKKAVKDLTDFVNSFNQDVPTYVQRLGDKIVFDTAKQLHDWGRI